HVLHDDEVRAFLFAPVVDRDDVRVVQVGGRAGLAAEALDERAVRCELGEKHLDGHRSGEEDLGHAAASEVLHDLIATVVNTQRHRIRGYELGRAAWSTARAIGAATTPPVASLTLGWFSTMTATTTLGASAGANATIHVCDVLLPVWAVPVLAAT